MLSAFSRLSLLYTFLVSDKTIGSQIIDEANRLRLCRDYVYGQDLVEVVVRHGVFVCRGVSEGRHGDVEAHYDCLSFTIISKNYEYEYRTYLYVSTIFVNFSE